MIRMNPSLLRKSCLGISIIGIFGTAVSSYLDAGSISVIFHRFSIWSYSPYIALAGFSFLTESTFKLKSIAGLLLALVAIGMGAHITNHQHPDAQGAMVYLFLPLWQWVGIIAAIVIFCMMSLIVDRSRG